MRLHEESVTVQHSEAVDDVSADSVIDVLGVELSAACLSIGGPICEVADDLVLAGEAVVKRAVVVVRSGRLRWRLPGLVPVLSGGGGCRGRGGSRWIFPLRKLRNDGLLGKVGHRDDGVGVPGLLITCLAFSTAGSLRPVTPLLIVVPVEAVTTLPPDPVLVHTQVELPTLGGCLVGSLNAGDFEARLTVSVFVRTLVLESEVQNPGLSLHQGRRLSLNCGPQWGRQRFGGVDIIFQLVDHRMRLDGDISRAYRHLVNQWPGLQVVDRLEERELRLGLAQREAQQDGDQQGRQHPAPECNGCYIILLILAIVQLRLFLFLIRK